MSITYKSRDQYIYTMIWFLSDFQDINLNTKNPAEQNLRIEPESDFAIEKLTYFYTYDGLETFAWATPIGGFQAKIFDSTNGRYWQNDYVEIDTIAGNGSLPFVLPIPKIMVGNSNISVTLLATTIPIAPDNNKFQFQLNFHGDKLFRG